MGDAFPAPRLVVGLGNPGPKYATTRHNAGFLVLDLLAGTSGQPAWQKEKSWNAEFCRTDTLFLLKPLTYMNASGEAVAAASRYLKILPGEILVLLDEIALPPGSLRLRRSGSAGGHNGLASILRCLGTDQIPRLRIGVGEAEGRPLHHHVLDTFTKDEWPVVSAAFRSAADCVSFVLENGYEAAMNSFNQKPNTPKTQP